MNNENASCAYDGEENAQLSPLQRLPVEIFLHICSFLDGSTLVHGLSLVCKQFYQILKDANSLWNARINHIWPDASYPLLPPASPDELCWMLSYFTIKQETALWKQQESRKKRLFIKKKSGYMNNIMNAVSLMHVNGISHAVYTSKTHLFYKELPQRKELSYEIENFGRIKLTHSSGIRDLTAIDNTIYSCSMDPNVKSWTLTNTGLVHQRTYDLPRSDRFSSLWSPCMSSCPGPRRDLFATGLDCGTIYVFDSRSRNNPICHYRPHTRDVNSLAMNAEYILSTSLDKTVSVWDQRAGRTMKSITFPGEAHFPTCINMRQDLVFVGTRTWDKSRSWDFPKLHVLNPKDDFKLVKSYSTEHTKSITRVHLTHECLITSSEDGTVRISSLTDPPKPIATLRSEIGGINDMDYLNGTLAVVGSGIKVWCPKLTCSTKRVQRNNNK